MRTHFPHRLSHLLGLSFLALGIAACGNAPPVKHPWTPKTDDEKNTSPDTVARDVPRDEWWREARFGLFVHWGLYALTEGRHGESEGYGEWIRASAEIPTEEYRSLSDRFDASGFDARTWARYAREAGMRYVVFTAKHHDGFCLFNSELTAFDAANAAAERDLLREVVEAFRSEGLRIGIYYSILDWDHPDYLPRREWQAPANEEAEFSRYVDYLRGQVTELLSNYGPIDVIWFDGQWESTWTHEHGLALNDLCRELVPAILVNNRVDKGRTEDGGTTRGFAGDFATPEQAIPTAPLDGPWESCLTMNSHWGWNAADQQWKSSQELVRTLIDVASKGGNLLLNVGPRGDGSFPPQAVERLQEIGAWMTKNGEAIRGTEASPIAAFPWGRATLKRRGERTTLYLHVFDWPQDGLIAVPGIGNRTAMRARVLADPKIQPRIEFQPDGIALRVPLRDTPPDALSTTIALDFSEEPIFHIEPRIYTATEVFVDPLEVRILAGSPRLKVRYTLDGSEPSENSTLYDGPFEITTSADLCARSFQSGKPVGPTARRKLLKQELRPGVEPANLEAGLWLRRESKRMDKLPNVGSEPTGDFEAVSEIQLDDQAEQEHVWQRWEGFLELPRSGVWRFALRSDDGSRLTMGRTVVVGNDGLHGSQIKEGAIALAAGLHPFAVDWFNATASGDLNLEVAPPGGDFVTLPPEFFRRLPR